jgi:hypothetical protein
MAPKKTEPASPTETNQTDDTRDALLTEVVALSERFDSFTKRIEAGFDAQRNLVGRLEDRIRALHERQNEIHAEWQTMRTQMVKHHLEQSSGAETVGAVVLKLKARVELLDKSMANLTDPHRIVNPLKVSVAACNDQLTKLRQDVERRLRETVDELEAKLPELKRIGKQRVT